MGIERESRGEPFVSAQHFQTSSANCLL